jgi:hypothetical protein
MAISQITTNSIADGTVIAADIASNTITSTQLTTTGVTATTYGSSTAIPIVTVDAAGRITTATTAALVTDPIPNILMLSGM